MDFVFRTVSLKPKLFGYHVMYEGISAQVLFAHAGFVLMYNNDYNESTPYLYTIVFHAVVCVVFVYLHLGLKIFSRYKFT